MSLSWVHMQYRRKCCVPAHLAVVVNMTVFVVSYENDKKKKKKKKKKSIYNFLDFGMNFYNYSYIYGVKFQ